MVSEADAADTAAGNLVGGEGLAVFVGEVAEAVDLGGLFQPVDEGFHFDVDDLLCASEADVDDDEGHVGDSEVAFGAFPQAELDGAVITEVVETSPDGVPVEYGFIVIAAEMSKKSAFISQGTLCIAWWECIRSAVYLLKSCCHFGELDLNVITMKSGPHTYLLS